MLLRYRYQCKSLLDTHRVANHEQNINHPVVQLLAGSHGTASDCQRVKQEEYRTYCGNLKISINSR